MTDLDSFDAPTRGLSSTKGDSRLLAGRLFLGQRGRQCATHSNHVHKAYTLHLPVTAIGVGLKPIFGIHSAMTFGLLLAP